MIPASATASLIDSTHGRDPLAGIARHAKGEKMNAAQIDSVSKDFESLFIAQMLEQMFGDSAGDEAFGDRETAEVYKGMMLDEYGKQITRAGGIGIASYVQRELIKQQEMI